MIKNPQKMVDNGIIVVIDPEGQVQQNWVDLTVWRIYRLVDEDRVNILTKDHREHCDRNLVEFDSANQVTLSEWEYDIEYWESFNLPNWISASVYTRSTVNRWGNFITSGYFDAWFNWKWGAMLHITKWILILEKWVRIAQMVCAESEIWKEYEGVYNDKTTV